ncbi:MAG: NUDIX domain-containing protein [Clostridiaceae bacterium]|nr:NUDIX domain-containing protein [Clostridiaceae bacterium]
MLIRDCAGGIVFFENQVLLIQNEKSEWSFPKGVIRDDDPDDEVATWRVKDEADVEARIVALAGRTSYEFYSLSRKKPVANRIIWYLMVSDSDHVIANKTQGIVEAKFFPINEALEKVTYSQDKSLLTLAIQKLKEINEEIE